MEPTPFLWLVGEEHALAAEVKKVATPHVWRHVQDILGHRSLATTERYLRLTITDLKEAHAKFHPRERL